MGSLQKIIAMDVKSNNRMISGKKISRLLSDLSKVHPSKRNLLLGGMGSVALMSLSKGSLSEVIDGGDLGMITATAEADRVVDTSFLEWGDAPSPEFFSQLQGLMEVAFRSAAFYADLVTDMLALGATASMSIIHPYALANRYQYGRQRTPYQAWRDAIYNTQRLGIAVDVPLIYANTETAPFAGFYYYIYGNGQPVTVPMETMGLTLPLNKIGRRGERTQAIPLEDFINSHTEPGNYYYNSRPYGYETYNDSWFTGKIIGNMSMLSEGNFTRNGDGSWNFNGLSRAAIPDVYDPNRGESYRSWANERWTEVLAMVPGTTYPVNITGALPLNFSGAR